MATASNTSALHIFETLREVCASREPLGVAEISRRLGLSLSTAQRALLTLTQSGYLKRHPYMAKYSIGFTAERLVNALLERFTIRPASVAFLRRIAASSRRTASLYVRIGWYSIRLVGIEAGHSADTRARRLGEAALLDSDAASLAILAHLSPEEIERFADFKVLSSADSALAEQLSAIRKAGFAYQRAETTRGAGAGGPLESLAFPIIGVEGDAVASVAIEGSPDEIFLDQHPVLSEWQDIVRELTRLVQTKRNLCVNPFSHLDPQTVRFGRREADEQDEPGEQDEDEADADASDEMPVGATRPPHEGASRLLELKVAVIAGGGSDLGRACVLRFLSEGASVVIADRDEAAGKETLRLARSSGFATVRYQRADVSKESDVKASIALATREFGRIDCVFNTVGASTSGAALAETTPEEFQSAINSQLLGVFLTLRQGAQALKQQGQSGTLICTAAVADKTGAPSALRSVATAAVIRLMQEFANELVPDKIRVNSIAPGPHPTPEDFASAALFLASDQSHYVNGTNLAVDDLPASK
jgi:NAD(P)-dependent dehydrogenase (short-subunit alcohol dehydrogenase family)/DNA-binding IclR family transcriptional regulator